MAANPAALKMVLTEASEKALTVKAIQVQNEARRLCPVDTGRLRASITFFIEGSSPRSMKAQIGTNVEYALPVHNGWSRRYGNGTVVTVAGRPFLKDAVRIVFG